jgi:hypothetical protein
MASVLEEDVGGEHAVFCNYFELKISDIPLSKVGFGDPALCGW